MSSSKGSHWCVEFAHLWTFADVLQGYDTMVGENGIKLSGGQRQRLAIARSIIKQPKILILDEATSSIDVHGEGIVQAALDRASNNRTTISIAHRLSTVKKAHKIIVLKDGAVAEQGTHMDLLMNQDGVYYNLVHAQHLDMNEMRQDSSPAGDSIDVKSTPNIQSDKSKISVVSNIVSQREEEMYKPRGLVNIIGLLLLEQSVHWRLYGLTVLAAIGSGGKRYTAYLK